MDVKSVINASQGACAKLFAEESVITAWGWQEEAFDSPRLVRDTGAQSREEGGRALGRKLGFLTRKMGQIPHLWQGAPYGASGIVGVPKCHLRLTGGRTREPRNPFSQKGQTQSGPLSTCPLSKALE